MIVIKIPEKPIPLKRPRACRQGNFIKVYDSQSKEKGRIKRHIFEFYSGNPLTIPISINIEFGMPIPKSTSKAKKLLMSKNEIYHTVKPDIDNLVKLILDCLNGIVFHDDAQVIEITARKKYSLDPFTIIKVKSIYEVESENDC